MRDIVGPSVVVKVVHVLRVAGLKPENHPPVRANSYCMKSAQSAMQRMHPPARGIHVGWPAGAIQRCQDQAQPCGVAGRNSGAGAVQEESLQALVAEAPDHSGV